MNRARISQTLIVGFLLFMCVSFLGVSLPVLTENETIPQTATMPVSLPAPINGKIIYPRQHIPAIILNGSQVELQIRAPSNITTWDVSLYREYRNYPLSNGPAVYNVSTSVWRLNITIPPTCISDLYDLNVTISDGLNWQILIEWNAIHVRYEFPTDPLIYHISDLHVGQGLADQIRSIRASLYEAAMAGADLIIATGDLTDMGTNAYIMDFKELMRNSRVPFVVCPGNHDRLGDTYAVYISQFGTDYYTFNLGPDIFIVMANSHHSPYEFNDTQLGWIERDFAASNAKLKIMGAHAPLMNPETFAYFLTQWDREELQRIFDTYNVSVYLNGHLHGDLVNVINNTYWIQTSPAGGSIRMYDPVWCHGQRALRPLKFINYELTSWSWQNLNLSQPIDALYIKRAPVEYVDADIGAYFSVNNTLGYSVTGQIVDILVEPLPGPEVYRSSGATVLETVNGTDAWLIRFSLDVADGELVVIRVFTSNAQAPSISNVDYPATAMIQNLVFIYADVTSPFSGIFFVSINISLAGGPFLSYSMSMAGVDRYRYYVYLLLPGEYQFAITAADYAGYEVTSSVYSFTVSQQVPSAPELRELNDVSETGNFTLIWTSSSDPDGSIDHYTLQMSNTSDFTAILNQQNTTELNYAISGLTNGVYYFRVCGVDNLGAQSAWSNVESISVELPGGTTTTPPPPIPGFPALAIAIGIILATAIGIITRRRRPD
ncbi:MAG: metallophosphoesterase [Promethearchaeota archaeon]